MKKSIVIMIVAVLFFVAAVSAVVGFSVYTHLSAEWEEFVYSLSYTENFVYDLLSCAAASLLMTVPLMVAGVEMYKIYEYVSEAEDEAEYYKGRYEKVTGSKR